MIVRLDLIFVHAAVLEMTRASGPLYGGICGLIEDSWASYEVMQISRFEAVFGGVVAEDVCHGDVFCLF